MYTVYWIKHKDHTDAYSQGYIGISSRVHRRWYEHRIESPNNIFNNAVKKYSWDNLESTVIFTGSLEACKALEIQMRPTHRIGWNLEPGGSLPPNHKGKKMPYMTLRMLKDNPKAVPIRYNGVDYPYITLLSDALGIKPQTLRARVRRNPAKYGYELIKE